MKTYNVIEINKIIRRCLKEAFPSVKFSVKKERWTIYVSWIDGPNSEQVDRVVGRFVGRGFNGMTDSQYSYYHTENDQDICINVDYLFLRREYSDAAKQNRLKIISKRFTDCIDQYEKDRRLYKALSKHSYVMPKQSETAQRFKIVGSELEDQEKAFAEIEAKKEETRKQEAMEKLNSRNNQYSKKVIKNKPVSVLVHWSESSDFKDNEILNFKEFERTCSNIVLKQGPNRGYDKTKITVTFENGDTYECRLDLSATCDNGFIDHINQMIEYSKTEKGSEYYRNYGSDLLPFLNNFYIEKSVQEVNHNTFKNVELH